MATATTAATTSSPPQPPPPSTELKTYWCHECDMSVSLTPSPSPTQLLCPHCNTHFLELMDSPFTQNDTVEPPLPSALFDVVFQDALSLLSPPPPPPKPRAIIIPVITVTAALLSSLDRNGVVLCAVCKDLISVDSEAKQLPCQHLYHSNCITPWLHIRPSCPLCRFNLVEEEEDDDEGEENDDVDEVNASSMRRQLVMRLSELSEDDFYGLRITLNHIASRHALLHSNVSSATQNTSNSGDGDGGDGESRS